MVTMIWITRDDGAAGTLSEWLADNGGDADFANFLRALTPGDSRLFGGGAGGSNTFTATPYVAECTCLADEDCPGCSPPDALYEHGFDCYDGSELEPECLRPW